MRSPTCGRRSHGCGEDGLHRSRYRVGGWSWESLWVLVEGVAAHRPAFRFLLEAPHSPAYPRAPCTEELTRAPGRAQLLPHSVPTVCAQGWGEEAAVSV